MKKEEKMDPIQWHPAFRGAIKTELKDERNNLNYIDEVSLTKKELKIDLLVIKKISDKPIKNAIGHQFLKYNIMEYKSPEDYLSIDDFYKVYAYACIYKSDVEKVDEIKITELTISFVVSRFPKKLVKHWREVLGYQLESHQKGIYYIKGNILPIQLILIKELDSREHKWLNSLTLNIEKELFVEVLEDYNESLKDEYKDVIIDTIIKANYKNLEKLKEDEAMTSTLRKLFEPELINAENIGIKKGMEKGMEKGIEKGKEEGKEEGKREGKEEGKKEGKEEGKRLLIVKAHQKGKSYEELADLFDMEVEEVKGIIKRVD